MAIRDEILKLKKERNAAILAHFYEEGDIQDIADYVGDSLYLAQQGEKLENPVILLAGVVFMAESVKILSPTKTVLVPDLAAGCSLVDHSPYDKYLKWKQDHPNSVLITYVNSSAEVKSISDVICTSSNAEKIIEAVPKDRTILFGPDRNLGRFLSRVSGRDMVLWPGACQVHILFSARKLHEMRKENPDAVVIAHPECDENILAQSDVVGSTSRLLKEVADNPTKKFIVATEDGIFHQMRNASPEAVLLQAPIEGSCACNQCPYMKMNSLEKIRRALETLSPQVNVDPSIIERARVPLRRMLDITAGRAVEWPAN